MALSAIHILNLEGKLLIQRKYRDIDDDSIDMFMPTLNKLADENSITPVFYCSDVSFAYMRTNDLYLVAAMQKNANIMMVFSIMKRVIDVLVEYIKVLTEESIQDNFVVIYELLDEMIDFGYPQITDNLKNFVIQKSYKLEKVARFSTNLTNSISWRPFGILYKKNEVFVDVVESLDVTAKSTGGLLRSEVNGCIKMRVKLSGMPQLRLGLNDKCLLDIEDEGEKYTSLCLSDIKFHQCVQLSRFNKDKTISFIPPDGEFELMSYRMETSIKPLISIVPLITYHPGSRVIYNIIATTQFRKTSTAYNIEIRIPVPPDVDSPTSSTSNGTAKYLPEDNVFLWFIKSLQGGKECSLKATMHLPTVSGEEFKARTPIEISFVIPYFTITGLQVKYLKIVEKNPYQALTWVRYITQNGQFYIKLM